MKKIVLIVTAILVAAPVYAASTDTHNYGTPNSPYPNNTWDPNWPGNQTRQQTSASALAAADSNHDPQVRRGAAETIAKSAGLGALACGGLDAGLQALGVSNKWATIISGVGGNSALLMANGALSKGGINHRLEPLSGFTGCSVGVAGVSAGSYIRSRNAANREAQRELLKNTEESKATEKALKDEIAKRDTSLKLLNEQLAKERSKSVQKDVLPHTKKPVKKKKVKKNLTKH